MLSKEELKKKFASYDAELHALHLRNERFIHLVNSLEDRIINVQNSNGNAIQNIMQSNMEFAEKMVSLQSDFYDRLKKQADRNYKFNKWDLILSRIGGYFCLGVIILLLVETVAKFFINTFLKG